MTRMNWDRVNRENRAIREANRVLAPEPTRPRVAPSKRRKPKRKRMTEKERALAWHRQNRTDWLNQQRNHATRPRTTT